MHACRALWAECVLSCALCVLLCAPCVLLQGGWLHGDVNTEDALQTLHTSMLRQEAAERSAHAAAAADVRMSKCYGAAGVGGVGEAEDLSGITSMPQDLSGITSTVPSSALQVAYRCARLPLPLRCARARVLLSVLRNSSCPRISQSRAVAADATAVCAGIKSCLGGY